MTAATKAAIAPATVPRLSVLVKIMYGVGEIANATKVVTFALYSLFFATVVKGLPGTWIGIVGFAAMLWDAVIDPYIGYLTDGVRANSKRLRFMLIGAVTMGVGFWAFFSPPRNLSTVMLFAWLLAASFVVRSATSMFSIPYYAVGVNLSSDYHERTSITGIRSMASAVGTMLTASLSFVVFFPEKVRGVDPKLDPAGYSTMGLVFGVMMTSVALIALSAIYPLRHTLESSSAETQKPVPGKFLAGIRESLHNPSFRVMLASFFLIVVGLTVSSSLFLHFLKYYVEVNGSTALGSSQAAFYGCGLLGMAFWIRASRRFDKHRLCVFSALVTAGLMLAGLALFGKGHLLGTGDVRPVLVGYGLSGFFNCILWFIPQSMLADVIDESELLTGTRREGALYGILSFTQQVAAGVAVLLAGALLEKFVGLVPGKPELSGVAVYRVAIVSSVVPAALFIAAAVLMLSYKLTRPRVESIQLELQQRRPVQNEVMDGIGG